MWCMWGGGAFRIFLRCPLEPPSLHSMTLIFISIFCALKFHLITKGHSVGMHTEHSYMCVFFFLGANNILKRERDRTV